MYNKCESFFNEEIVVKDTFENGFSTKQDKYELSKVASYIVSHSNGDKTDVRNRLIHALETKYPDYESKKDSRIFKSIIETGIKNGFKYTLRKPYPVPVSQSEINQIKTAKTDDARKIIFSCLIMAKAKKLSPVDRVLLSNSEEMHNRYYLSNNDLKYVPAVSGVNVSKKQILEVLNNHPALFRVKDKYVELLFVDADSDSEPVFIISDFSSISDEYNRVIGTFSKACECCGSYFTPSRKSNIYCDDCSGYKPGKYESKVVSTPCCDCGKPFERNSNRQIRCLDCRKTKHREVARISQRKMRENS